MPWANCLGDAGSLAPPAYRRTCLGRVNVTKRGASAAVVESGTGAALCLRTLVFFFNWRVV